MKKIVLIVFAALFSSMVLAVDIPNGWTDDIQSALKQAANEKKKVLILFTGSDWCGYCKMLKKDVLDKKGFKRFAKKNLVLVYFDFPMKNKPNAKQMAIQRQWQKKFGVRGYPTAVIVDSKGQRLSEIVGSGQEDVYLKKLEAICKK